MAANAPGKRIGPPRKPRQQTQTEKAHRYEPFNKRIARLKIDPVHKVQRSRIADTSDDISQSFFRAALEEWAELNLTQTFSSFLNTVNSRCESLPQLIHHADFIANALLEHIRKYDPLALDALLSLAAHLAHDLGQEFGKYLLETVTVVLDAATVQSDPAVVESCFTCLAWMYKYLSRLLVKDLRPLFDVVLPHFSSRKEYIRRFTAESLAFLLRKAASLCRKDPEPISLAIEHLLLTNAASLDAKLLDQYAMTCMTLLVESAIGVDAGLHTSAPDLYGYVHRHVSASTSLLASQVFEGFTVGLIHRTDDVGFRSIENYILTQAEASRTSPIGADHSSTLLFIATSTRGGTRVSDWFRLLSTLTSRLEVSSTTDETLVQTVTAAMCHAPLDELLPFKTRMIAPIMKGHPSRNFFSFCEAIARLNEARFKDLVLPELQKYIVTNWDQDQDGLALLLYDLVGIGVTCNQAGESNYLSIGDQWEDSIAAAWQHPQPDHPFICRSLALNKSTKFPRSTRTREQLSTSLQRCVQSANVTRKAIEVSDRILLGWGLQLLCTLSTTPSFLDNLIAEHLTQQPKDRLQLLPYVQALADNPSIFIGALKRNPSNNVIPYLTDNLRCSSIELRKTSLRLLILAGSQENTSTWLTDIALVLTEVLDTDYTIANARKLGMLLRRLPHLQKSVPSAESFSYILPYFILGLLPNYYDQLRREAISALEPMLSDSQVEEKVLSILREWLQASQEHHSAPSTATEPDEIHASPFVCTRLEAIRTAHKNASHAFTTASSTMVGLVESNHAPHKPQCPAGSRIIALEVMKQMPGLAEKRSKLIVPAFLAAQRSRKGVHGVPFEETDSTNTLSPEIEEQTWTLRERKLFLDIISQFHNPKVLYRAADVHQTLLELLSNGDCEVRKLALLALLSWRDKTMVKHRDALIQLAEDKSNTLDLAAMLNSDPGSAILDVDSRSAILPVILRIVLGLLVGRAGTYGTQEAKRKAILRVVFRMGDAEISTFLKLMLGPLKDVTLSDNTNSVLETDLINQDQQYGFLRMALSMLEILQHRFEMFGRQIIAAILYCTLRACYQLNQNSSQDPGSLVRNIRRTGIQTLNMLLEHCPGLDLLPYKTIIWTSMINPRLTDFVSENSQGVSSLLKMISLCTRSVDRLRLLHNDAIDVLPQCWDLLISKHTQTSVKAFVLEHIAKPFFDTADANAELQSAAEYAAKQAAYLLDISSTLLEQQPSKEILGFTATLIRRLVNYAPNAKNRQKVVALLGLLLQESNHRLPPHVKGQIMHALDALLAEPQILPNDVQFEGLFETVAEYLDFFRDVPNRNICGQVLHKLSLGDQNLIRAAAICEDLNKRSQTSLDEVDHDIQSAAFGRIHDALSSEPVSRSMLPVFHNLIFLIRTSNDQAIRGNVLSCLKHLVKRVGADLDLARPIPSLLLSAVKKHLRDDSEIVRADFIEILGVAVQFWQTNPTLRDLEPLLVGQDEEASFFSNILHIQQHRRTRAIRRCLAEIEKGTISARNIADYLLPLFSKFAFDDSPDSTAQTAKGHSIASMTVLLQWLDWKDFRRVFRQYRQALDQRSREDKVDVRLLNHAADALVKAMTSISDTHDEGPRTHLSASLPTTILVAQELQGQFIPKLAELSHYKDEGELSERLPAAVVAIKLIKLLPEDEVAGAATPIVLDVAQVLRSRTQEVRDLARKQLAEIVKILGPSSFQFVAKALQTALTRGYQLHVLSFTLHTILLTTADQRALGDLDYCLEDLVKIVLDDAFGIVGQEKDNENYVSDMKEVKSSKSFDSMEILAKSTSVGHLSKLLLPFQALLKGSMTSRQNRHADEFLRRIGVGISHSTAAKSQDLLILSFELIQQFYQSKTSTVSRVKTNDERNRERFIVQKENASRSGPASLSTQTYKLVKFAIDIARSSFAREKDLLTPQNVNGFLSVIGDALIEAQEDVKISALRLLSTVIKLPMRELSENAMLYVMEAVKVVKASTSTNEEAAQAALKLVAAIVREKRDVQVRESDIAYLLKRTMPDLEEPDRQGVTFNFVKAVMARGMQMPEIYELVDKLGLMMVTSHSRNSRDAARGVYAHFLIDYPQGKTRWSKQVKFLVKNLEYQHPEGRQSIMEAISTLIQKTPSQTAQELAAVIFIPIVLRLANDPDERCREMAGALLSQIFDKVPSGLHMGMLEPVHSWIEQHENVVLMSVGFQAFTIYFKACGREAEDEVSFIKGCLPSIIGVAHEDGDGWQCIYHALELMQVLVADFPEQLLSKDQEQLWLYALELVSSSHSWLQSSASRLLGLFFQACAVDSRVLIPLSSAYGLSFSEASLITLLRKSVRVLKQSSTTADTIEAVSSNVLFLLRCMEMSGTQMPIAERQSGSNGTGNDEDVNESDDDALEEQHTDSVTNASISTTQYLLDQSSKILRYEPSKQVSSAIRPKLSITTILHAILPQLSKQSTAQAQDSLVSILIPLLHMTSTSTPIPRSADPTFGDTYQALIEQSQLVLETIQSKAEHKLYARLVTAATKQAREKRQERRNKRAFANISEPEKAAKQKRQKFEKKKQRRKEISGMHRSYRRRDLGF